MSAFCFTIGIVARRPGGYHLDYAQQRGAAQKTEIGTVQTRAFAVGRAGSVKPLQQVRELLALGASQRRQE